MRRSCPVARRRSWIGGLTLYRWRRRAAQSARAFFLRHHRGRLRGEGLGSGAFHLTGWMTRCRRNYPAPSLRRLAAGIHPRPWESHRFPAPSGGRTPEQVAAVMRLRACPSAVLILWSPVRQCVVQALAFTMPRGELPLCWPGSRLRPVADRLPDTATARRIAAQAWVIPAVVSVSGRRRDTGRCFAGGTNRSRTSLAALTSRCLAISTIFLAMASAPSSMAANATRVTRFLLPAGLPLALPD